jgi:hypothetical protein
MSFTNFNGGLINSIAVGGASTVATGLSNAFSGSPVNFSVNSLLSDAVENASGYALNSGSNYLLSQVSSLVPTDVNNGLNNAIATQIASVGLNQLRTFTQRGITGGFGNLISGLAPSPLANKGTVSVPMDVVSQLPDANYGGSLYTLTDIVFSVVPANAGPQTQPQPQSSPTVPWDTGFSPDFNNTIPGLDALKGATALAGPAKGVAIGGKNYGSFYSYGKVTPLSSLGSSASVKNIPVNW